MSAPKQQQVKAPASSPSIDVSQDELSQKRQILQAIKDFDFQIKKNQEEITQLKEKTDRLSKDLDDLVSLYEIVSEHMNPFVGLSKVTKKRLDMLENFTKEVDDLKNRMNEIESLIEQNKGVLGSIQRQVLKAEKTQASSEDTLSGAIKLPDQGLNTDYVDMIIAQSLESILLEQKLDSILDEYISMLKT